MRNSCMSYNCMANISLMLWQVASNCKTILTSQFKCRSFHQSSTQMIQPQLNNWFTLFCWISLGEGLWLNEDLVVSPAHSPLFDGKASVFFEGIYFFRWPLTQLCQRFDVWCLGGDQEVGVAKIRARSSYVLLSVLRVVCFDALVFTKFPRTKDVSL